jgi:2-hydroxycyclohexanecarboxyl-CoA dehydrogenase
MFLEKLRLDGRAVVQFGAGGGGMGTSTALALAEAGATLIAVDLTDDLVKATEQRIAEIGGKCHTVVGDVRSADDIRRARSMSPRNTAARQVW